MPRVETSGTPEQPHESQQSLSVRKSPTWGARLIVAKTKQGVTSGLRDMKEGWQGIVEDVEGAAKKVGKLVAPKNAEERAVSSFVNESDSERSSLEQLKGVVTEVTRKGKTAKEEVVSGIKGAVQDVKSTIQDRSASRKTSSEMKDEIDNMDATSLRKIDKRARQLKHDPELFGYWLSKLAIVASNSSEDNPFAISSSQLVTIQNAMREWPNEQKIENINTFISALGQNSENRSSKQNADLAIWLVVEFSGKPFEEAIGTEEAVQILSQVFEEWAGDWETDGNLSAMLYARYTNPNSEMMDSHLTIDGEFYTAAELGAQGEFVSDLRQGVSWASIQWDKQLNEEVRDHTEAAYQKFIGKGFYGLLSRELGTEYRKRDKEYEAFFIEHDEVMATLEEERDQLKEAQHEIQQDMHHVSNALAEVEKSKGLFKGMASKKKMKAELKALQLNMSEQRGQSEVRFNKQQEIREKNYASKKSEVLKTYEAEYRQIESQAESARKQAEVRLDELTEVINSSIEGNPNSEDVAAFQLILAATTVDELEKMISTHQGNDIILGSIHMKIGRLKEIDKIESAKTSNLEKLQIGYAKISEEMKKQHETQKIELQKAMQTDRVLNGRFFDQMDQLVSKAIKNPGDKSLIQEIIDTLQLRDKALRSQIANLDIKIERVDKEGEARITAQHPTERRMLKMMEKIFNAAKELDQKYTLEGVKKLEGFIKEFFTAQAKNNDHPISLEDQKHVLHFVKMLDQFSSKIKLLEQGGDRDNPLVEDQINEISDSNYLEFIFFMTQNKKDFKDLQPLVEKLMKGGSDLKTAFMHPENLKIVEAAKSELDQLKEKLLNKESELNNKLLVWRHVQNLRPKAPTEEQENAIKEMEREKANQWQAELLEIAKLLEKVNSALKQYDISTKMQILSKATYKEINSQSNFHALAESLESQTPYLTVYARISILSRMIDDGVTKGENILGFIAQPEKSKVIPEWQERIASQESKKTKLLEQKRKLELKVGLITDEESLSLSSFLGESVSSKSSVSKESVSEAPKKISGDDREELKRLQREIETIDKDINALQSKIRDVEALRVRWDRTSDKAERMQIFKDLNAAIYDGTAINPRSKEDEQSIARRLSEGLAEVCKNYRERWEMLVNAPARQEEFPPQGIDPNVSPRTQRYTALKQLLTKKTSDAAEAEAPRWKLPNFTKKVGLGANSTAAMTSRGRGSSLLQSREEDSSRSRTPSISSPTSSSKSEEEISFTSLESRRLKRASSSSKALYEGLDEIGEASREESARESDSVSETTPLKNFLSLEANESEKSTKKKGLKISNPFKSNKTKRK